MEGERKEGEGLGLGFGGRGRGGRRVGGRKERGKGEQETVELQHLAKKVFSYSAQIPGCHALS